MNENSLATLADAIRILNDATNRARSAGLQAYAEDVEHAVALLRNIVTTDGPAR